MDQSWPRDFFILGMTMFAVVCLKSEFNCKQTSFFFKSEVYSFSVPCLYGTVNKQLQEQYC